MGLRSGLPDLVILKNNKIVFVELKRLKGSTTSDEQIAWIEALQKCQNVFAKICYGADDAIKFIESV